MGKVKKYTKAQQKKNKGKDSSTNDMDEGLSTHEEMQKMKALSLGKLKQAFKKLDKKHKIRVDAMMTKRRGVSKRTLDGKEGRREMKIEVKKLNDEYESEKKNIFKEVEEKAEKEEENKCED